MTIWFLKFGKNQLESTNVFVNKDVCPGLSSCVISNISRAYNIIVFWVIFYYELFKFTVFAPLSAPGA